MTNNYTVDLQTIEAIIPFNPVVARMKSEVEEVNKLEKHPLYCGIYRISLESCIKFFYSSPSQSGCARSFAQYDTIAKLSFQSPSLAISAIPPAVL